MEDEKVEPEVDNKVKVIEDEVNALMKRDIFIRRGRNNRVYYKAIANDVF